MQTKSNWCIDCIRAGINPPAEKYMKTSYCLPHNSARSASSTSAAKLRGIIKSRNWSALSQTDKMGAPMFPYDVLADVIEHHREIGMKAVARVQTMPEDQKVLDDGTISPAFSYPYDEAYTALETAECLLHRRDLTGIEKAKIREIIVPTKQASLDQYDRANNRAVEPSVERGPVGVGNDEASEYDPINDRLPGRPA